MCRDDVKALTQNDKTERHMIGNKLQDLTKFTQELANRFHKREMYFQEEKEGWVGKIARLREDIEKQMEATNIANFAFKNQW